MCSGCEGKAKLYNHNTRATRSVHQSKNGTLFMFEPAPSFHIVRINMIEGTK